MPHEYPKMTGSGTQNFKDATENATPCSSAPKEKARMVANEKENSRGGTSSENSKAPIPEHIHDINAKTFYKLGQFLGKVKSTILQVIYIFFHLGRLCFLLPSYFRGGRQAICCENCPEIIFNKTKTEKQGIFILNNFLK